MYLHALEKGGVLAVGGKELHTVLLEQRHNVGAGWNNSGNNLGNNGTIQGTIWENGTIWGISWEQSLTLGNNLGII
jgi:hypothetical protein